MEQKKEGYLKPEIVKHELLRDITAQRSGHDHGHGRGHGGRHDD